MNASINNSSLILLAFILDPKLTERIRDFQKNMIRRFELPKDSYPKVPPNIPFLSAKWIAPERITDLEIVVDTWALNQTATPITLGRVKNIQDTSVYLEAFPAHNPYSGSLTELFHRVFTQEEKDLREPYHYLLIPIIKKIVPGTESVIREITEHLLTEQIDDYIEIDSISILKYADNKSDWVEHATYAFRGK